MINMENREITPESIIKNSEHDCTPTIILYKTQWHTVYDWMQEYSYEQNKKLLDEIEMLKFQLKAADSVNENLSKELKYKENENKCFSKIIKDVYNKCNGIKDERIHLLIEERLESNDLIDIILK